MSENAGPHGAVAYAVATWVFLMHVDGVVADDAEVAKHAADIAAAQEANEGNAAGEALVATVGALLQGSDAAAVTSVARALFGEQVHTGLGEGERGERLHRIRKFQFATNRPWLARIWERSEAGEVAPVWLVVEAVTDQVQAMDPNPWNDIDEERSIPVADFQVLWELDGCTAVAVG